MRYCVLLFAVSAILGLCVKPALAQVVLRLSPPGTSAGVGLSPLNEVLAGAPGLGGSGSGGETGGGILFDPATIELRFEVGYGSAAGFTDLTDSAFAWYLHGPATVDQAGPVLIDLSPWHHFAPDPLRGGFLGGAVSLTPQQANEVLRGLSYINIYTAGFPGGEIRGQLVPIPEPTMFAGLFGLGLAAFAGYRRFRA